VAAGMGSKDALESLNKIITGKTDDFEDAEEV